MQRKLIFLACFFICANCLAQLPESRGQYPFVHYTPREGLVNNKARFIFQDSKGKIYVATFGGLSIYDGTRFINFNYNDGLGNDLVNDVVEMGEDSIWILSNAKKINYITNGRLKVFTPADNFTPVINKLIKCSDGNYYAISDEGLFRLHDRKFIKISLTGLPEGQEPISLNQAIEFDKKLFIVSNPGYKSNGNILVYDLVAKKLIAYKLGVNPIFLFSPSAKELWISSQTGFYRFDKLIGNDISLNPFPDSFHFPRKIIPHFIYKDRQGNLWLTIPEGVYKISRDGETTLLTKENGLTIDFQTSVFQDAENNMWFTNEQTGLCKLSNQQLVYYPVFKTGLTPTDISITPFSDSVWLYDAYHRRILLSLPHGRTKNFLLNRTDLGSGRFVPAKKIFILSGNNIFSWNKTSNDQLASFTHYYTSPDPTEGFTDALIDNNGNLIAASTKIVLFTNNKVLSESFEYMTDQFAIDKNNRIWVAPRSNKLFCFEISGSGNDIKLSLLKIFQRVTPNSPRSITVDHNGNVWNGTRNQGIFCLYLDGLNIRSVRNITTQNGLSENFVTYLYCDKENNIWASSPSGVDRIKVVNNNFSIENITKSNNLYLPVVKVQQAANGMMWILSTAGVITYNPNRPPLGRWKPQLGFLEIINSNKGDIFMPQNRELKYFQNNLAFQLSAPTYIDEKQTRFSYMLKGSGNENWSEPSTNSSINFVNLSSGDYTLKAKAIFLHGLYPDVESSYSFTVLPPWWLTWWFKLLMGILILGLALLGLRFYINRKLELQRAALEKRRAIEKERTRIATDMHDDLGAGLSQIKFLSETIGIKKQKHLPIEEEINSIRSFSNEMIDKMGEIVWALNEKNDTLSDLLSYTRSYAAEYLAQNGIKCRVEEPDNISQGYVSSEFRRNIYLTVKESLHNIVKHAQATEVFIKIEITDWLNIQIKDNGIGINNPAVRSSGNGLISMNNRIKELKGRFEIVNNNGTVVKILVPLKQ